MPRAATRAASAGGALARGPDVPARGPGAPVPPTFIFFLAFTGAVWWHNRQPWPVQPMPPHVPRLVAGAVLMAFGLALFAAGLRTFTRHRTGIMLQRAATRVVTSGPYRWSRNPMYVSFVTLYLGGTLLVNTLWPLVALPLVILALDRLVIAREESYMHHTFGGEYDAYCRRVHRWL